MRRFSKSRIPWSPCGLTRAVLGDTRPEATQGELAGVTEQLPGCLQEMPL
jgi:hypothetical protein